MCQNRDVTLMKWNWQWSWSAYYDWERKRSWWFGWLPLKSVIQAYCSYAKYKIHMMMSDTVMWHFCLRIRSEYFIFSAFYIWNAFHIFSACFMLSTCSLFICYICYHVVCIYLLSWREANLPWEASHASGRWGRQSSVHLHCSWIA